MKRIFTLCLCFVLGLQIGFGQCELTATAVVLDPWPGGLADACWDDEFGYGLLVEATGSNGTNWNYTIDGGALLEGGTFGEYLYSGVLPVFGPDQFLNDFDIQVFSEAEPECTTSLTVYAPTPDDCECIPFMEYNLASEVDDNGTPDICWDDFVVLDFFNVTANNISTYELLLDNQLMHTGTIGDAGGSIMVPANKTHQRLTIRGGDLWAYSCVNVYELVVPENTNCPDVGNIHLALGELEACTEETICIPLVAKAFDYMLGFQFSISYDSESLVYAGTQNFNPLVPGFGPGNIGSIVAGSVTATWNDPNAIGISLPAETVMVEFCFTTTEELEISSELYFSNTPTPIEFVDSNGLEINQNLTNGLVTNLIIADTTNLLVFNNETPELYTDDSFILEILVEHTDVAATSWEAFNEEGELLFSGAYGVAFETPLFPMYQEGLEPDTLTLSIVDQTAENCRTSLAFTPPEIENVNCEINLELIACTCEDNDSPFDPSDDLFYCWVDISGNNTSFEGWVSDDIGVPGSTGEALYGLYEFGPYSNFNEDHTLTVTDQSDTECTASVSLSPPFCNGLSCNLTTSVEIFPCDDNGTPDNFSDDFFTAEIVVANEESLIGWFAIDESGNSLGTGYYDQPTTIGPLSASENDVLIRIIDVEYIDCNEFALITPPSCEVFCEMVVSQIGDIDIFDNETPNQCSDDTYSIYLQVSAAGTISTGWQIVLDDNSLSEVFPYEEEVFVGFLPVYDDCGRLNTSFQIVDATHTSCSENINIVESSPVNVCNCEALFCYTEEGINDNGTPFDCTDDFMEIQVESNFISAIGTEYEVLLDNEVVNSVPLSASVSSVLVPTDGIAHTLTVREIANPACFTSELLPVFELCGGNDSFYLALGDVAACAGETVCLPLIAHRFDDILGFQFSVNYSPEELQFVGFQNFTDELPGFSGGSVAHPSEGNVTFSFNTPSGISASLADATMLLELCFNVVETTTTTVNFSATTTLIEIIDGNEMPVVPFFANGQVTCECLTNEACNFLQGQVLNSSDCLTGEIPLASWLIEFSNEEYLAYRQSDGNGNYAIYLPVGDFAVKLIPSTEVWEACQSEGYSISFSTAGETQNLDLLAQATEECALLEVDISLGVMRRCFEDQVISIGYENVGTLPVVDGLVGLHLPAALTYSGTNGALIGTSGDTLVFAINSPLALGTQGQFEVYVDVSCDAVLNSSLCVSALSLPYDPCPAPDENWSGGSVVVTGECTGEEVVFNIRNEGDNPLSLGNSYIIIQDGVMLFQVPEMIPPLLSGESTQVSFTADGSTYRIETSQEPFHPGFSLPTAVVEGCGINENGEISTGFVTYFPNNDVDYYIDEDCQIVTGSYDPNDKQAEPGGYGGEHYILPEQQLEYTIRFQNTGNDTAFTVIIRDTLSDWLDMQTFRPGISSHSYELSFDSAHALSFVFNDILLPDSMTNLAASQGFITYKIRPKTTTPLETRIENTAAIYFDFNEPIITNTTYHQLGDNFIEIVNSTHEVKDYNTWEVFPNPVQNTLTLIDEKGQNANVLIYDAFGREKIKATISNGYHIVDVKALVAGWYTLQIISEDGRLITATKLIKVE